MHTVRQRICELLEAYDVKAVCAYNAAFDTKALNTTERWVTKSRYRYFLPYGTQIYCIWTMACNLICTQKRYIKYCLANGFVSPAGNIQTNAEKVFGYISKDKDFSESHTGLRDVLIEAQIMAHCYRQHKKFPKEIDRGCWRVPQKVKKEMEQ